MKSGHRFHAQTLHAFIQAVFRQMGSHEQEAQQVADHLIAANLAGHDSHGIGMIPSYIRSFSQGHLQINRHAKIVKDAGAIVTLEGDCGFGQVVAREAMTLGIEKAQKYGIAAVALHNAHHIGRIGYWAEQCAAAGFVSIHFVNVVGIPMVAPFNGRDSRFGTDPFCVVFPRKNDFPLLLDYATSAIAFGKTRVAWHKGVAVPEGCLIDAAGVPTTDPAVMQVSPLGSLLTFAQHKGYALAAMCEILGGALSGGKTTHQETLQESADAIINCMTTIVINPELFGAPDCDEQVAAFAGWVKASPHADDAPVLLPGEWEVGMRNERLAQGIPLDAGSWQAICDAARQTGMPETTLQAFCRQLEC
ncbi:malate/lactate/ureidoglycolate dehydrogenase [Citrobacter amalonaticus]|uniref:Malate/lactate/ureidoglycolate dehydrogenase n=1 Tax=Citrobacter amalonaticus TaxID=35703 RepID=A0A2S4RZE4_CITAM|nr:malate/lactate/ureidoglycolate dehydrogenase [Citrobacter amalonaticus]POT58031.1 malate/lactate/ureidoglycolate dehydrogenase [Citrobacter amalonaticus]POT76444.1 malate/lactate/ureidoglycolate dehydrogenase [Citrobacter amalonaticus]POU66557.1 malate/lactate/ureidoglycolate dehydrogenase [Citrobacter amalonaticus]POV05679.1 malate/lactate/ureidoglycolate dehydrogenase [Citrobacter amalonaticus]